jgi:uncharacterized phage-associated protein
MGTAATVHDVAAFIIAEIGQTTAMKLQKLVYYAQAWSLVWDNRPLFSEPIEAWANGPVVRSVFAQHRGAISVNSWPGDPSKLTSEQRATMLAVLGFYGQFDGDALSELTHREEPWIKAREGVARGAYSRKPVDHEALRSYYGQIPIEAKSFPDSYARGLRLILQLAEDEVEMISKGESTDSPGVIQWLQGKGDLPG